MPAIFVTFAVLKEERLRLVSDWHPLNMFRIFVTFAVLSEDRLADRRA